MIAWRRADYATEALVQFDDRTLRNINRIWGREARREALESLSSEDARLDAMADAMGGDE